MARADRGARARATLGLGALLRELPRRMPDGCVALAALRDRPRGGLGVAPIRAPTAARFRADGDGGAPRERDRVASTTRRKRTRDRWSRAGPGGWRRRGEDDVRHGAHGLARSRARHAARAPRPPGALARDPCGGVRLESRALAPHRTGGASRAAALRVYGARPLSAVPSGPAPLRGRGRPVCPAPFPPPQTCPVRC